MPGWLAGAGLPAQGHGAVRCNLGAVAANKGKAMSEMLQLSAPWWHFVLRAVAVYVMVMVLVRISGKRAVGQFTPFDLVLLILQVHDELVFEVDAGFVETLLPEVGARMAAAAELKVPLVVDSGVGDNWDEAH